MAKTMRAWVFTEAKKMRLEEVPLPEPAANEVLVKTGAVGICGSDISYYYGHSPLGTPDGKGPLILGHEISGTIAATGSGLKTGLRPGQRVVVNPVQQCNACPACADGRFNICPNVETIGVSANGGFAEYVAVRESHVMTIADSMALETASLTEPLACAVYGMRKLDLRLGDKVVVIGSGSIGLMMVEIAKARGAGRIALVGTRDFPLEAGRELGADILVNSKNASSPYYAADVKDAVRDAFGGGLADRVIVPTSAKQALAQALEVSGPYATVVYFGLPGPDDTIEVPALETIQADKTIKFSWLAPLCWPEALAAQANGNVRLSSLISHRYSFAEVEKGIIEMAEGPQDKIKGVVIL